MRRLTTSELLIIQDMCIDAEFRCHERAVKAQLRGDDSGALRELTRREQYQNLKEAVLEELFGRGNHDPLDASLVRVRAGIKEDSPVASNEQDRHGAKGLLRAT